jgi:hypothetical protein
MHNKFCKQMWIEPNNSSLITFYNIWTVNKKQSVTKLYWMVWTRLNMIDTRTFSILPSPLPSQKEKKGKIVILTFKNRASYT